MTEREAAEKLAVLLDEIEAAGHDVWLDHGATFIVVGEVHFVHEPTFVDQSWTVEGCE